MGLQSASFDNSSKRYQPIHILSATKYLNLNYIVVHFFNILVCKDAANMIKEDTVPVRTNNLFQISYQV